ncbi:type-2 ice-structuring protein-like [Sphaeramia orbicularis]|uniref:type-2 ice-structuring protein-like n=1 Tax=Sphaeramia orbicularis TaxID=375764 RepID=UPI00117D31C5|nr:type-2 ice-structuring protein-like [Sphaeramia orbicularis]
MLTVSVLLCALVALSTADDEATRSRPTCAEGWSPYEKDCFHYFEEKMSWVDAEMNCQKHNGNLASVHSQEELDFIHSLVPDNSTGVGLWLGGSNCQQDDTWLWKDGSAFKFTFWCPEEPNNLFGRQHCLQADLGALKCWNDLQCGVTLPSVCRSDL